MGREYEGVNTQSSDLGDVRSYEDFLKWFEDNYPNAAMKKAEFTLDKLKEKYPELENYVLSAKDRVRYNTLCQDIRLQALYKLIATRPAVDTEPCVGMVNGKPHFTWGKAKEHIIHGTHPIYVVSFDCEDWVVHKPLSNEVVKAFTVEAPNSNAITNIYPAIKAQAVAAAAELMHVSVSDAYKLWAKMGFAQYSPANPDKNFVVSFYPPTVFNSASKLIVNLMGDEFVYNGISRNTNEPAKNRPFQIYECYKHLDIQGNFYGIDADEKYLYSKIEKIISINNAAQSVEVQINVFDLMEELTGVHIDPVEPGL